MRSRSLTLMNKLRRTAALSAAFAAVPAASHAATYQNYVKSLSPSYYFELNETSTSQGVLDSVSGTYMGSYNGDYEFGLPLVGVPGPDLMFEGGAWSLDGWSELGAEVPVVGLGPNNLAHYSANEGHINIGPTTNFAAGAMTVSLFARGDGAQGGDRLFTNNVSDPLTSFQIVVGNDGIVVSVNPSLECPAGGPCGHKSLFFPGQGGDGFTGAGADRGLVGFAGGWFHIVASTSGSTAQERVDNIQLWLNGVNRTEDFKPGTTGWGVNEETGQAKIGGRRADPTDSTTHSGEQDEVAIWLDRVLTNQEALNLYLAATDPNFVIPEPVDNADFNGDGAVDGKDLLIWQRGNGIASGGSLASGDADGNGAVDGADLAIWENQFGGEAASFGAIPEPTSAVLLGLASLLGFRRRRS